MRFSRDELVDRVAEHRVAVLEHEPALEVEHRDRVRDARRDDLSAERFIALDRCRLLDAMHRLHRAGDDARAEGVDLEGETAVDAAELEESAAERAAEDHGAGRLGKESPPRTIASPVRAVTTVIS